MDVRQDGNAHGRAEYTDAVAALSVPAVRLGGAFPPRGAVTDLSPVLHRSAASRCVCPLERTPSRTKGAQPSGSRSLMSDISAICSAGRASREVWPLHRPELGGSQRVPALASQPAGVSAAQPSSQAIRRPLADTLTRGTNGDRAAGPGRFCAAPWPLRPPSGTGSPTCQPRALLVPPAGITSEADRPKPVRRAQRRSPSPLVAPSATSGTRKPAEHPLLRRSSHPRGQRPRGGA